MKNWEQEARQLDDRTRQQQRLIEELEGERDELAGELARATMQVRHLAFALGVYADHDNWSDLEDEHGEPTGDPLYFVHQNGHVLYGWSAAEAALVVGGLCKRDGDEVVEIEPGTVWPVAQRDTTTKGDDHA